MFRSATSFNQNIGGWNVEALTNAATMFRGTTLSTQNYDALLIGWNAQNLQSGVPFHGGNSTYCNGETARANMISLDGWSITDGGKDCGGTNQPPVALCQDITVEAGAGCVADADVDGESYDPDGDEITITQDPAGPYSLGDTVVTLIVTDDSGAIDTCTAVVTVVDTMPPFIAVATVAPQLVEVGQTVYFDGVADDECDPTVAWNFGDGDTSADIVTTHAYTAPDIHNVTLTVTDSSGNASTEPFMVVVYDPSGGFVTGGGWIYSEAGNYANDPEAEGRANFGFVSKYKKGAEVPTGNTEFQFKTADLNFHSSTYDWLVVTGSDYARFKGSGTINGMGDYRFMLWAGDAPDTFRIKIWEEDETSGDEFDVYDNGFEGSGYENGQPIDGGSIVIHTGK
jgi:hypothetical protein